MTSSKIARRESDLHHDLSGGIAKEFQESFNKVCNFIESHRNPYKAKGNIIPHHFVRDTIIQPEIGVLKYDQFHKERFMLKEKLLSDTTSEIDVPNMLSEKSKPKSTSRQIKSNNKMVGIA